MIQYKTGNIIKEDVEALVNTVNCVGIMGRGLALQFKKEFPDNYKAYVQACKKEQVHPGKMFVFKTEQLMNPQYIVNFPTKRHWKSKSKIEDIEAGLENLVQLIRTFQIKSIAIPPLGSGLGGLDWKRVKKTIGQKLSGLDCQITVFEPLSQEVIQTQSTRMPAMTAGRAALIGLIDRYLNGLMDPFISLLEVHKLMYFMQEAGEPLRLMYKKASFGPYAENLRHVLHVVEGHYIDGYVDGGDSPSKQLKLVPGAVEDAMQYLVNKKQTLQNFNKVVDLVDGFETPFGLELLSTVHWVVTHDHAQNIEEVVNTIYDWNERKKQFSPIQIQTALKTLIHKQWIFRSIN